MTWNARFKNIDLRPTQMPFARYVRLLRSQTIKSRFKFLGDEIIGCCDG